MRVVMSADNLVPGELEAFWETGTEGVVWSVIKDGFEGYDALYCLGNGDFLRIYDEAGSVIFEDEIKLEWKRNYQPYPLNPSLGQQAVNGYWVRGLQHNVVPEVWSTWFHSRLRCEFRQMRR
jgi:hypothetical protein